MTVPDEVAQELADRYRLERQVGQGGMATVYLAHDVRHRREVAIKVLRPELAAVTGADRFRREIEIAAGLHHPHILPLFDSGEAGGSLYYVMPYEEGQTLRERLEEEGALTTPVAVALLREVIGALAYAHGRGVVHRDIKPANVLLSGRHAMVTDFGIAKAVGAAAEGTEATSLTRTGMSLGTPTYMAPEQVAGDGAVDHRADIYAVGVMAYEMLAGRPPFTGASAQQVLAAHLTQAPQPLREVASAVPAALEAAIMRCLAKDPDDRWQSADDLLTALEALPAGDSGARTPATPMPAHRPRRWPLVAAAVLVLAGIAGLAWYRQEGRIGTLIGSDVIAAHDEILVADFVNRTADSTLAATVSDAIRIDLQGSNVVEVVSQARMWQATRQMELTPGAALPDTRLRELAERLGARAYIAGDLAPLGTGYQLTARVVATADGAEVLLVRSVAAGDAELITALDELARKLRRGIGESLRSVAVAPALAQATTASLAALRAYTTAQRAELQGDRRLSNDLLQEALALDSTFASAWYLLSINHYNSDRHDEAMAAVDRAWAHRDKLPGISRLGLEGFYHTLHGNLEQAEAADRRLIEMYDRGWTSLADNLLAQGRFAAAESAAMIDVARRGRSPVVYWNAVEAQVAQRRFAAADSTIAVLDSVLPGNDWTAGIRLGTMLARREFDTVAAWAANPQGSPAAPPPFMVCLLHLAGARLDAWRGCDPELDADSPFKILAEARLTGDTATGRQRLTRLLAQPPDSTDIEEAPQRIMAAAELGTPAQARQLAAAWRAAVGDGRRRAVDEPMVEGAVAMAEGRYEEAATHFLDWNRSGHLGAGHLHSRGLPEAAAALDLAGQPDSAAALYRRALDMPSLGPGPWYERLWYHQALRRLGEWHESRGEPEQALTHYQELLHLWRDADPVMAPQVEALRERVARLAGEPEAGR